ncbi:MULTISPECIES: C4-dicarboxylate TRAP transporter substrate-binding protein [Marinobacter]|uniref:TRAP-type C4-dicarboxylate transport system, substrate-binding protein n=1 Tax=Marinobacter segnicrescens TaxID=430453 RepID=A0A1I0FSS8_9GAMM|nr:MULTISPECIES: C4-dicarboxylate TRAP transporter substrate-binding protein [Marinobacter]UZD65307.1 C4-dicarboxylate TRAP transporter substrate-binding protein [Marinobacter sp. AN1]SET60610.1 TRAP-type C4-dicarboxylate transport system, substrate-binding protein [Marinobacter segnicrescens]
MKTRNRTGILSMATLASAVLMSSAADARELNYALGAPPGTPAHEALEFYADKVGELSGGDLTVKVFPLSLLSFAEMSSGIRDGIADMGLILTPYHAGEFPPINLLAESSMLLTLEEELEAGKEGVAFGAALSEFMMFHCPECIDRFEQQNQVYLGHAAGTAYGLMCDEPVMSLEDVGGKRVRVGAGNFARWSEAMGATPVTMSANEMREAISQGIVDCIALSSPEIQNYGLVGLVTDLTMAVPGGVFPFASFQTNQDLWRSLSDKERETLLRGAAEGNAAISWTYVEAAEESFELVREEGARFHEADESLVKATSDFIATDMETLAKQYEERYGLDNAEAMLDAFRPILSDWAARVAQVDSQEELANLYWEYIFSKVDPASHGL